MPDDDLPDVPDYVALLRAATDGAAPYTEEARARAAFAAMAQQIAEAAIRLLRVNGKTDVALVQEVDGFLKVSRMLLARAVVAARTGNASWEKIGDVLGITRQSAQARFGADWDAWTAAYAEEPGTTLPAAAGDTGAAAAELDAWLLAHLPHIDRTYTHVTYPDAPVSGGLARMDPHEESGDITRRERLLWNRHVSPPLAELAALADREAVLHDQMAEIGLNPAGERQAAARCRAMAAGYRAQAAAAESAAAESGR